MLLSELLDRYIHHSASDPIVRHQLQVYVRSRSEVEVLMETNDQTAAERYVNAHVIQWVHEESPSHFSATTDSTNS